MYVTSEQLWESFNELSDTRAKPVTQKQLLKAEQKSHRGFLGMAQKKKQGRLEFVISGHPDQTEACPDIINLISWF